MGKKTPIKAAPPPIPQAPSFDFSPWAYLLGHPALVWAFGIFTLLIFALYAAHPIDDPDIWWHLKTGQWISQAGKLPGNDPFSFLLEGKRWVAHEWLAQWSFWKVWEGGGAWSLYLFRETLAVLLGAVLFLMGASIPAAACGVLLFSFSFFGYGLVERPWFFSFFFVLAYRFVIPRLAAADKPWVWGAVLILLHAAWTNFHGGASFVGIIIMGSYGAGYLWQKEYGAFKRILAVSFCALGTSLIHPEGLGVYERLFAELFDPMHRWVTEKEPLTPKEAHFWPYAIYFTALLAAASRLKGSARITAFILAAGFGGVFAFKNIRNVPWAFFITVPDLMRGMAAFFHENKKAYTLAALPLFAAGLWTLKPPPDPNPITQEWNKGACDFIERHAFKGRMYNDYVNGGYLIWRLSPEKHKVFIDGRGLEYGDKLLSMLYYVSTPEGFEAMDKLYQFDFAVFQARKDQRLLYLDNSKDWVCVYFDDGAFVYVHRQRASADLAKRFGYRYIKANEPHFEYLLKYFPAQKNAVYAELERSMRVPPEFSLNAYLTKSYLLQVVEGPQAWALWIVNEQFRFEHPAWQAQAQAARQMIP